MPCIRREKIAREKVYSLSATLTDDLFHPQEVLYVSVFAATQTAFCSVKVADLFFKFGTQ
jgi:hypothetical protein